MKPNSNTLIKEPWLSKTSSKLIVLLVAVSVIFAGILYYNYNNQSNNNSTNAMNESTRTLENGLKIEDTQIGTGAEAINGKLIEMHYTGYLEDGTIFDSSLDRGEPFVFKLGTGQVIQGWEQGIPGIKVGGKRKLTIPSDLAYGESGIGGLIPGGATLIFEVEALGVK
jgi:FKBP-type peptidyl-prolyl cis-trans isomerase